MVKLALSKMELCHLLSYLKIEISCQFDIISATFWHAIFMRGTDFMKWKIFSSSDAEEIVHTFICRLKDYGIRKDLYLSKCIWYVTRCWLTCNHSNPLRIFLAPLTHSEYVMCCNTSKMLLWYIIILKLNSNYLLNTITNSYNVTR